MPMPSMSNRAVPIRMSRAWLLPGAIDIAVVILRGDIAQQFYLAIRASQVIPAQRIPHRLVSWIRLVGRMSRALITISRITRTRSRNEPAIAVDVARPLKCPGSENDILTVAVRGHTLTPP